MGRIHLVTGGARSGKSDFARRLCEDMAGPRVFIATCPVLDEEMRDRVERHRKERAAGGWAMVEEQVKVAEAIREAQSAAVVLVDCLTLWINNLMYAAEQKGWLLSDEDMVERCRELLAAGRAHPGDVVLVTNEVGMGIVPENTAARMFRDLAGRANQVMAAGGDRVTILVAGLPVELKKP